MALPSGALETYAHALGTYMFSCTGKHARLFFILEARDAQGAAGHVATPEPTSVGR
jgi:hypothetical protein